MKVLEVSPAGLFLLLLAAAAHGAAVAAAVALRDVLFRLSDLLRASSLARAVGIEARIPLTGAGRPTGRAFRLGLAVSDFCLCLGAAAGLLCVNFIWNNGKFRLFTVTVSLISFGICDRSVGWALRKLLVIPVRTIRVLLRWAAFPAVLIYRGARTLILRAAARVGRRLQTARIHRTTKREMSRLGRIAEHGLIGLDPLPRLPSSGQLK